MTAGRPRVVAHVGVLNEAGIIGPCVEHLRTVGVDGIVVFDLGSTDGTRDVLAGLEGRDLKVVDFPEDGTDELLMRMAGQSLKECTADWCVLMDADEFPLPRGGDLPAVLGRSSVDLVELPRYNVALGEGGQLCMNLPPHGPGEYDAIDLFVDPTHGARRRIEANPTMCWLRSIPAAKIAVRPDRVSRVVRGLHDAHPLPGRTLERERSRDILIAHAALTDYPRFQRKIASIRATFADYGGEMSKQFAWHWRRWVAMDDAGELAAEYDRSCLTEDEMQELRAAGILKSVGRLFDESSGLEGGTEGSAKGNYQLGEA